MRPVCLDRVHIISPLLLLFFFLLRQFRKIVLSNSFRKLLLSTLLQRSIFFALAYGGLIVASGIILTAVGGHITTIFLRIK